LAKLSYSFLKEEKQDRKEEVWGHTRGWGLVKVIDDSLKLLVISAEGIWRQGSWGGGGKRETETEISTIATDCMHVKRGLSARMTAYCEGGSIFPHGFREHSIGIKRAREKEGRGALKTREGECGTPGF